MQNKPENTKCYILKSNMRFKFCCQYKSYKQPPRWSLCTFSGAEPHSLPGNVADVFIYACSSSHKNKTAHVGLSILLTKFKAHNGGEQVLHDVEFFRICCKPNLTWVYMKGSDLGFPKTESKRLCKNDQLKANHTIFLSRIKAMCYLPLEPATAVIIHLILYPIFCFFFFSLL